MSFGEEGQEDPGAGLLTMLLVKFAEILIIVVYHKGAALSRTIRAFWKNSLGLPLSGERLLLTEPQRAIDLRR